MIFVMLRLTSVKPVKNEGWGVTMPKVEIESPSRAAFTLIDLEGSGGRVNGGAGVALARPNFRCSIEPSTSIAVENESGQPFEYINEVSEYLERTSDTILSFSH